MYPLPIEDEDSDDATVDSSYHSHSLNASGKLLPENNTDAPTVYPYSVLRWEVPIAVVPPMLPERAVMHGDGVERRAVL